MKIIDNIIALRKYFKLSLVQKEIPKSELLSSNESLKQFGKMWNDNKADVMMMLAVIEYEYASDNVYEAKEIAAVKQTLGRVAKFLQGCGSEWSQYEYKQDKK